jgi:predicted AAA+ superfamily ATPase
VPLDSAMLMLADYLADICRTDIQVVDGVARDPRRLQRLLRGLGRNVATSAALTTLAGDTAEDGTSLATHTIADYLRALERLYVVEDQPAWDPHLRSRVHLRRSPKRHFVDPSLAVAALGADPPSLLRDLNLLGLLFESLVVRDLRIYSQPIDRRVCHYRDNKGLEVDAIVEGRGAWAAFEVKLGGQKAIDAAAASLLKFARRIDTDRIGEPAALAVVVATGYGYVREDGVQVIPIAALGP